MSTNRFRFTFQEPHGERTRGFEVAANQAGPALALATFAARKECPGWVLVDAAHMPPPTNNVVPFPSARSAHR
jgi:hypothetical protein